MLWKRIRQGAARVKNRFLRLFRKDPTPPHLKNSKRWIEAGWRDPSVLKPPSVVELSSKRPWGEEAPRLLILQMAHIGDFVVSMPALQKIRAGFAKSHITLVCASWNADLARQSGLVDEVVVFDFFPSLSQDWRGSSASLYERFAELPLGTYDIAVDLRHDSDTRPCLDSVRASVRVGYAAGSTRLDLMLPAFEHISLPEGSFYSLHAQMRFDLLAEAVVARYAKRPPHPLLGLVTPQPRGRAYAVLAIGAGDMIRHWPQEYFEELAFRLIVLYDFDILIVCGEPERAKGEAIVACLAGRGQCLCGRALTELIPILAHAALLVGLGSGITHMAAALGTPTVGLLSGVSPLDVWQPVGERTVSLVGETPCSPCNLKVPEDCPFGTACITTILPSRVLETVRDILKRYL